MRICIFEDHGFADLEPLTLTRPVFELLCGMGTLAAKQCQHFAPCEVGYLVRPELVALTRLEHPGCPVNDLAWLHAAPTVMVNGRWLSPAEGITDLGSPCVALAGEEVAYAVLGPDRLTYCSPRTIADCPAIWKNTLPVRQAGGWLVKHLWELVDQNGNQLCADFEARHRNPPSPPPFDRRDLALVGPANKLIIDPTARLDPMVVIDTRQGPVVIDREAEVLAFTRLEGPCVIGPRTQVLGAKVRAGTTIGPNCRIGGEVEASIIQGHTSKYHEGFLGHSYLGEWINLGAGTQTSDLRNDYGPVRVTLHGRPVDTGLTKVGSFLGDHTKTALGTLLNTGTHAGIFCNLLPSGPLLSKYIPSFCSVWRGALADSSDVKGLLQTADLVMRRRDRVLTDCHADLYRQRFEEGADERRRTIREAEQSQWRKSA